MDGFEFEHLSSLAATPVGIILIYYFAKLNNRISILENEIKHLRELIYNVGQLNGKGKK